MSVAHLDEILNALYQYDIGDTMEELLEGVKDGSLFGVVKCDIQMPDTNEKREMWGGKMAQEYFHQITPIFKNCDIVREDASDHMHQFAEQHG